MRWSRQVAALAGCAAGRELALPAQAARGVGRVKDELNLRMERLGGYFNPLGPGAFARATCHPVALTLVD